jgi:hypothetical protein
MHCLPSLLPSFHLYVSFVKRSILGYSGVAKAIRGAAIPMKYLLLLIQNQRFQARQPDLALFVQLYR